MARLPDVLGLTLAEATKKLRDAGFTGAILPNNDTRDASKIPETASRIEPVTAALAKKDAPILLFLQPKAAVNPTTVTSTGTPTP